MGGHEPVDEISFQRMSQTQFGRIYILACRICTVAFRSGWLGQSSDNRTYAAWMGRVMIRTVGRSAARISKSLKGLDSSNHHLYLLVSDALLKGLQRDDD